MSKQSRAEVIKSWVTVATVEITSHASLPLAWVHDLFVIGSINHAMHKNGNVIRVLVNKKDTARARRAIQLASTTFEMNTLSAAHRLLYSDN